MISIKKETIKVIDEKEAQKKPVYDKVSSIYDKEKGELEFDYKTVTGKDWRLVHDGVKVHGLIEGGEKGETVTIHEVEEFATKQECLDRIKDLGLIYDETQITESVT